MKKTSWVAGWAEGLVAGVLFGLLFGALFTVAVLKHHPEFIVFVR